MRELHSLFKFELLASVLILVEIEFVKAGSTL